MSGIDKFSIIVLVILVLAAVVIWVALAMLPGKIAHRRNHPQAEAINIGGWLGALLGGVLWPLVLIWAYTRQSPAPRADEDADEIEVLRARLATLEKKLATDWGDRA